MALTFLKNKHFWVVKLARGFLKGLYISQRDRRIFNDKFSKINAVSKGGSGPEPGRPWSKG